MKRTVIAIIGEHNAGKTTTAEAAIRQLSSRGFEVAAVKTIHEVDFTIDTERKDTWRFARAGARTIVALSQDEIATVERGDTSKLTLEDILERCGKADIVFLEGSRQLHEKSDIPKIVVVSSEKAATIAARTVRPVLAFTGPFSTEKLFPNVPYVDVLREPQKLGDLITDLIEETG